MAVTRSDDRLTAYPGAPYPDATHLDEAVDRVRELSMRLWAIREAHAPGRTRLGRLRCRTCGQPAPCDTLRAAGDIRLPRSA